jgi:hypothetical protein
MVAEGEGDGNETKAEKVEKRGSRPSSTTATMPGFGQQKKWSRSQGCYTRPLKRCISFNAWRDLGSLITATRRDPSSTVTCSCLQPPALAQVPQPVFHLLPCPGQRQAGESLKLADYRNGPDQATAGQSRFRVEHPHCTIGKHRRNPPAMHDPLKTPSLVDCRIQRGAISRGKA